MPGGEPRATSLLALAAWPTRLGRLRLLETANAVAFGRRRVDDELHAGLVKYGKAVVVELEPAGTGMVEQTAGRNERGDVAGVPEVDKARRGAPQAVEQSVDAWVFGPLGAVQTEL